MSGPAVREDPRIWQDALDLVAWVRVQVKGTDPLSLRVHERALDVLERAALALRRSPDRVQALNVLDEAVTVLRAVLRAAEHCGLLDAARYADVSGRVDGLGRQVGGWLRKELEAVEMEVRR